MQLPDVSDATVSNVVRLADGARKTRVLYAGDMDFAKAQFASVAPQLQLIPAAAVLTPPAQGPATPSETPDAALIDCGAPGVDARAVVEAIRDRGLDLPIVLALDPGGSDTSATKVTAELRVDDYTVKLPGWLARLTSRLEFAIAHHRRRRSLEALQASAERLRNVVETAPVCLARVARDGTILAMNAAAMKMVSADAPEDVLGKSLLTFVDANGSDTVRRFLDMVSAGQPGSLEFETPGSARVVDTRAVPLTPDQEGRGSALLVLRDATERKRLEDSMLAATNGSALQPAEPLVEERDGLRQQLEAALEQCRRIQEERDAVRAEADEARARASMVEHVRAACTAAEQQLGDIQAKHQQLAAERDTLAADLAETRVRLEAAAAEHQAERERQQALLKSVETERDEHRAAREAAEAQARRLQQPDPLAAEREALLSSLAELRKQFDEMSASLDAAEARHAADLKEQRDATTAAEARLREAEQTRAHLSEERDELRAALDAATQRAQTLQSALDDSSSSRESRIAEGDTARRDLEQRIEELQRRIDAAIAERDAIRDELRAEVAAANRRADELQGRVETVAGERDAARDEARDGIYAANSRTSQLQSALDEVRAARDAQAAQADVVRRELTERVEELHTRVQAATAERDAVRHEMRLALDSADARTLQLQTALDHLSAGRQTEAAEGNAIRQTLTRRVEELQTRLDAVIVDREALERSLEAARGQHEAKLREAAAARESVQRRLDEREREYKLLCSQLAELRSWREREEGRAAAASVQPPAADAAPAAESDIRDAQVAFREAFELLSGELQNAVETTRAQHAAMLRAQPPAYDALEERLRQAETDCRRLAAERDERDTTVRALQAEIAQLIDLRREQRKELVRALRESEETERRSAERLGECVRLRHMLVEAQTALQRLSKWASSQSARLGASPVEGRRTLSRIEAPAAHPAGHDDNGVPPAEASWS